MAFYILPKWKKDVTVEKGVKPFRDNNGNILKDSNGNPIQTIGEIRTQKKCLYWLFWKLYCKKV